MEGNIKNLLPVVSAKELAKVENNMLNPQQLKYLLQKTPKNHIYKRKAKGGGTWDYVTGVYMKKVLNLMFGWDWSFEIVEHKFDLEVKQAYVLGKLTVNSGGRSIVKMQFGRADIKVKQSDGLPLDIGNDLKAASTDALKKCAAELGIASDVYAPNEFKEVLIIENPELQDDAEKEEYILELLADEKLKITEEDRMNAQRIIETKETKSYDKLIKFLLSKKP